MDKHNIKTKIRELAVKDNNEVCGFVVYDRAAQTPMVIPVQNISERPRVNFNISAEDYLRVHKKYVPLAIYHSHCVDYSTEEVNQFSERDKKSAQRMAMPMILYSVTHDQFNMYTPDNCKTAPILGRDFVWGFWDCYTLARDYWKVNFGYRYPCDDFLELGDQMEWYEGGLFERHIDALQSHGINTKTSFSDIEDGDMMFFKIKSKKFIDHVGIYKDSNILLHHQMGGLSHTDIIDERWINKFEIGASLNA